MGRGRAAAIVAASIVMIVSSLGAEGPSLSVSIGFSGYVVPGLWAPLWIAPGRPVESGTIEVLRGSSSEGSIERFPCHGTLPVECPVFLQNDAPPIVVRLRSGSDLVAETSIDPVRTVFPGNIVLGCGLSSGQALAITEALKPLEPVRVANVAASGLPANGLDWDDVAALVLADPEVVLTPAQATALKSWLSGGGRMAVLGSPGSSRNLLSSLGIVAGSDEGRPDEVRVGFGGLGFISREAADAASPAAWRSLLSLGPYERNSRLSAGRFSDAAAAIDAFSADDISQQTGALPVVAVLLWAALVLVLGRLVSGRVRVQSYAAVTILAVVIALAGGGWVDRERRHGAAAVLRIVVLPDGGGVFAASSARLFPSGALGFRELKSLPWGLRFAYGEEESGLLHPDARAVFAWTHGTPLSSLSVASATVDTAILVGSLPVAVLAGSRPATVGAVLSGPDREASGRPSSDGSPVAGGPPPIDPEPGRPLVFVSGWPEMAWWENNGAGWAKLASRPTWLSEDAHWTTELLAARPGLGWLIGEDELPNLGFRVHGSPVIARWAIPAGNQAGGR